jgi:hypothetical protein
MCGITCFAAKTSDMTLTSKIFCHLSVGVSMPPSTEIPALETNRPTRRSGRSWPRRGSHVLLATNICRHGKGTDRGGHALAVRLSEIRQHDVRALLSEPRAEREADTACVAGHDGNLVLVVHRSSVPLGSQG